MPRHHFISGLPRSGSTLLAALLRQNPAISAGISSPVATLFNAVSSSMGVWTETASLLSDAHRERILRGLFESYYADQPDKQVIVDTNRAWCSKMPVLKRLYPDSKVICCVRSLAWVMDSIERLTRKHPLTESKLFSDDAERATVYTRTEALGKYDRLMGYPWTALKEAFYGEYSHNLLLVDFDLLTSSPGRVMDLIYDFIGEPRFSHSFTNITFDEPAFDQELGLPGLHKVHTEVKPIQRQTVLPPDLFQRLDDMSFWRDLTGSRAHLIAATPTTPATPAAA